MFIYLSPDFDFNCYPINGGLEIAALISLNEMCRVKSTSSQSTSLPILVIRAVPISVSLACGARSCTSTVNAVVEGYPSVSFACLTAMPFPQSAEWSISA